jgi:hypothetical protein
VIARLEITILTTTKCAFWNIAFSLVGTYNSKNTNEIKQIFRTSKCSPIIFTDASPKGIPSRESNKRQFRNNINSSRL